jgi:hypothetical protein
MPSWNSRLEVQVATDPDAKTFTTLTPITSFTTTFASSITQIHSIEADNVGVIQKPQTMTFTMTVPAIGPDQTNPHDTAATLYKLAIDGKPFHVSLAVASGNDWVFKQLLFRNCYITAASGSNVMVGTTSGQLDTTPIATFSGVVTDFGEADITTA